MAYVSKEWVTGETITAEKLNNLEQGLADCCGESELFIVDLVSQDGETFTASEPRGDILSAISDGKVVLARYKFAMGDTLAIGGTATIRYWMGVYSALIDWGMSNIEGSLAATIKYIINTSLQNDYTWIIQPEQGR